MLRRPRPDRLPGAAPAAQRDPSFLYAFDLLELNGTDMRREPIEVRKATLASILRRSRPGVRLDEHLEHPDGLVVFQHACRMGRWVWRASSQSGLARGIGPGRSPDWLKFKNPGAPAVKREAEEDWGCRATIKVRGERQSG